MKSITIYNFLAVIILLASQGCNTYQHVPSHQVNPLFESKREIRGYLSTNDAFLSYSPVNHFGFFMHGFHVKQDYSKSKFLDDGSESIAEASNLTKTFDLGFVYYSLLSKNWNFEISGGGGGGSVDFHKAYYEINTQPDTSYDYSFKSKTLYFFLQPCMWYSGEYFKAVFSTKISKYFFNDITIENPFPQKFLDAGGKSNISLFLVEPAFTLKIGIKTLQLDTQIGSSLSLIHKMETKPFWVKMGICFMIPIRDKSCN